MQPNRDAFHAGFFEKFSSLGIDKADLCEGLFEKNALVGEISSGFKNVAMPLLELFAKVPMYGAIPAAAGAGGLWMMMQKVKADKARRKLYQKRVKELDSVLEDLEVSGIVPREDDDREMF